MAWNRNGNGKKILTGNFTKICEQEGKSVSKVREREGKKNSIYEIWEQESKALVPGNGREQEFPLGAYHAKTAKKTQNYIQSPVPIFGQICYSCCKTGLSMPKINQSIYRLFLLWC